MYDAINKSDVITNISQSFQNFPIHSSAVLVAMLSLLDAV